MVFGLFPFRGKCDRCGEQLKIPELSFGTFFCARSRRRQSQQWAIISRESKIRFITTLYSPTVCSIFCSLIYDWWNRTAFRYLDLGPWSSWVKFLALEADLMSIILRHHHVDSCYICMEFIDSLVPARSRPWVHVELQHPLLFKVLKQDKARDSAAGWS